MQSLLLFEKTDNMGLQKFKLLKIDSNFSDAATKKMNQLSKFSVKIVLTSTLQIC